MMDIYIYTYIYIYNNNNGKIIYKWNIATENPPSIDDFPNDSFIFDRFFLAVELMILEGNLIGSRKPHRRFVPSKTIAGICQDIGCDRLPKNQETNKIIYHPCFPASHV